MSFNSTVATVNAEALYSISRRCCRLSAKQCCFAITAAEHFDTPDIVIHEEILSLLSCQPVIPVHAGWCCALYSGLDCSVCLVDGFIYTVHYEVRST